MAASVGNAASIHPQKGSNKKMYEMERAIWDLEKNLISISMPIEINKQLKNSQKVPNSCKKPPRPPKSLELKGFVKKTMNKESALKIEKSRKNRSKESSSFDLGTILSLIFTLVVIALVTFQGFASMFRDT